MFDSTKEDLKDILRWADDGKLQLPDFQRDYVWGDEDVRSLIASVAKGFPVGALLTLETGGVVEFKPRLLEGVGAKEVKPEQLLLDGQQRITSLFQSAFAKRPVKTRTQKKTEIERFYYLDIKRAVSAIADVEDAIIGVPASRVMKKDFGRGTEIDLSSREAEFQHDAFPLNQVFDSREWFYGWRDYWRPKGRDVSDLERDFDRGVVDRFSRYKMPIIKLDKGNSREAICLVFEKVNVGGKKLDAFELVTAIYAADNYPLRDDWNGPEDKTKPGRRARIIGAPNRRDVLAEVASTDFLQACTLLHTRDQRSVAARSGATGKDLPQISCKREALLALPLTAYKAYSEAVERGFVEAGGFLNEHKIIWHRDVPYPPQIVALASVFAVLDRAAQTAAAKTKLGQWFWCVTLTEQYGSSTETKLARDVPELIDWLTGGGGLPSSIDTALFQSDRLRSLRSRLSAAYKGLHALVMRQGCLDFITGRPTDIMTFFNDRIDVHHIFPEKWCKDRGITPAVYNSIVNKTPLSKVSNITIGGNAPSEYLKRIEEKQGVASAKLDDILRTHLIEPDLLRADDFKTFFDKRLVALSGLVANAMQKPVVDATGSNEAERDITSVEEDDALDDLEAA
jgi:hypothetical protein